MKPFAFALLIVVSVSACASFGTFAGQDSSDVTFYPTPEENMARGEAAYDGKNYNEASAYYEYTKTKFPYNELAKTAELRLADADYERDRFLEARDRYQNFVRLHPTHPRVDYAAYRGALTHYKEIPSDFFLLPPATEKDQVEVKNALAAMGDFQRTYPGSEYLPDAKKILDEVKLRLAEHELYVADFYANPNRQRWPAVVNRLKVVERLYSGIGLDERVAFQMYEAHLKMKEPWNARGDLERYAAKFPETTGGKRAAKLALGLPKEAPAEATPIPAPPADASAVDAGS